MANTSFLLLLLPLFSLPLLFLLRFLFPPPSSLPPSPPGWPIIGNLLQFRHSLTGRICPDLGPIFTLWFGPVPFIVVTSSDIAHEALVQKGSLFASRPRIPSRALFTSNYRNINSSVYGPYWRALRRNLVCEMLGSSKVKAFRPFRRQIIQSLVQQFKDDAKRDGGVVAVYSTCRTAMFELLVFMCLGRQLERHVVSEMAYVIQEILAMQTGLPSDYFPLLRVLESKRMQERQNFRQREDALFLPLIQEHQKLREVRAVASGNYLDTLMDLELEGGSKLTDEEMVTLCVEFINAATDTTVNCLEWAMANLVIHQDIQSRLHAEAERTVGKRPLEEEELENLPYLKAVIKETLRIHPPGHFTVPHMVTEPCKLAGYDVPREALVNFHLPSISRNACTWPDPWSFKPERFLGEREIDMTGSRKVTMIPFGAGRRMCPGAGLAMTHASLIVGRLVQEFEWKARRPGEVVDMEEMCGFTVRMKKPLTASIRARGGAGRGEKLGEVLAMAETKPATVPVK